MNESPILKVTLGQLVVSQGTRLVSSKWLLIDQQHIQKFADATGDHQWIHVDSDRAANSVYGSTIAHGYLTLSLISGLRTSCLQIEDALMSVNYGLEKVRFTAPLTVNDHVRAHYALTSIRKLSDVEYQLHWHVEMERKSDGRMVCIAEPISRIRTRPQQ